MKDLLYICTATLLPLIPAFVIYRTLNKYVPSRTRLSGTPGLFGFIKGLKVDVQGAGAGYFLLVFVIFGYITTRPEPPQCSSYSVEGRLLLSPAEPLSVDTVQVALLPPQITVTPDGVFRTTVFLPYRAALLPTLLIQYPGYHDAPVELDPDSQFTTPNVRRSDGRISIHDPVIVRKRDANEPPYPLIPK